tara:strand:- start:617 stop:916 length:300 start_codon:yes stop_codon:yes gene_type:complete
VDKWIFEMTDSDEFIELLDPMPLASLATLIGGAVKDPIVSRFKNKEVDENEWQSMPNEDRRELIDNEFDVTKDWAYLKPITKFELKNIEADIYKGLTKL